MRGIERERPSKPRGWHTSAELQTQWGLSLSGTRAKIKQYVHSGAFERMKIFENHCWKFAYRYLDYSQPSYHP